MKIHSDLSLLNPAILSDCVPMEVPSSAIELKRGYLYKRGAFRRNWQCRLFVLNGSSLTYFDINVPKGSLDLEHFEVVCNPTSPEDVTCRPFSFALRPARGPTGSRRSSGLFGSSRDSGRVYYLQAFSQEEKDEWVELISSVCAQATPSRP